MAIVLVRYFGGAAAAAGTPEEKVVLDDVTTVAAITALLPARGDRPDLPRVLAASSFLLDAVSARPDDVVPDGATLDVLPPFAGG